MSPAEGFYGRLEELISDPGTVSARILLLRQLLESIYKETSNTSRMSFGSMFARMQYVNESRQLSAEDVAQANKLRILGNQVAHEEVTDLTEDAFVSGVLTLSRLLQVFYQQEAPHQITEWLQTNDAKPFSAFRDSKKLSFSVVIDSWQIQADDRGETGLAIQATDESGQHCKLLLNNDFKKGNEGRNYHLLGRSLWKHATLLCLNLSQSSGSEHFYLSNPQTLLVLEPDFLIDASSLAECFSSRRSNPEFYILNRLFSSASSDKMLLGQTVNNIFDELIFEPEAGFNELFKRSLASSPISMISLGKAAALDIYNLAEQNHFPQLKQFVQKLGSARIMLEPSFICPQYGLQGRLDLLYHQNEKYSIMELKSGSAPEFKTWRAHQMQVVAYNLIIRSCFGSSNTGISSILYSGTRNNPERYVESYFINEQDLLLCRNRIVGIMHLLAEQPKVFFDWLAQYSEEGENPIQRKLMDDFRSFISQLEAYEYEWFLEQVKRVIREIWFVKTGSTGTDRDSVYGYNALWQDSIYSKQSAYKIITDLKIAEVNGKTIRLKRQNDDGVNDFRTGDIIVLYRQSQAVQQQQLYRGSIMALDPDGIELYIRGGIKNNPNPGGDEAWCLEHDILESSLYTPLSSLVTFLNGDKDLRQVWLGLREPKRVAYDVSNDYLSDLCHKLNAAQDYHIVQGPPGTGKTSGLLTHYISTIYHQTQKRLLILSFTNRAVDEICGSLRKHDIPFIRTGSSQSVDAELLSKQITGKTFDQIEEIIKGNRIWLATVQSCSAWLQDFLNIMPFDELIIDEASQIIELNILGMISKLGKTILVGDQNQLPPITIQAPELYVFQDSRLQDLGYSYYSQSLLERLFRHCRKQGWESSVSVLTRHYRMHEDIAYMIHSWYDDRLESVIDRQKQELKHSPAVLGKARLIWIECPPTVQNHYDPLQARAIHRVIRMLIEGGEVTDPAREIGIVSPYRSMIHCLAAELSAELQGITIDTVERFQGSERDLMLITLPLRKAGDLHTMEAVSADGLIDRKLNVAVSRARERLIIFGNRGLCQSSIHYRNLIDKIKQKGIWIPVQEIIS